MEETPSEAGDDPALEATDPQDAEFASLLRRVAGAPARGVAVSTTEEPELAPGTVLDDKLRIERVIGRGGMGVVYLAQHEPLSREVALKLTGGAATPVGTERLLREARAMASITHENVITVYDVGTIEGQVFIAMEYLDGGTARSWLRERKRSCAEIVALYAKAAKGLAAAHARGVIHRDFKPDNILVAKDGRVRVADFGLAHAPGLTETLDLGAPRASGGAEEPLVPSGSTAVTNDDARLTVTGAAVGTPGYMAPEQLQGHPAGHASDQFALCVSLHEALFGRRPFAGKTAASILEAIERQQPHEHTPNSEVPAHVRKAVTRGLAVDPKARFASVHDLVRELSRDPAARLRRQAATVLALGGTAFGTWLLARDDEDPCRGAQPQLAQHWNAGVAGEIEQAFRATALPYAEDAWSHSQTQLQAYADAWVAAHQDTCRATRVHDTQSAELMDLRMSCLRRRLAALAATVDVLRVPDADVVRNATAAAAQLPRLDRCADTEALREIGTIPPEHQQVAATVRDQLAHAKANLDAGKVQEGRALAERALALAEPIGLPILDAESNTMMALALRGFREWEAARPHAQAGVAAAIVARDDDIAARLATALHYIEGYRLRTSDAEGWARLADAWITRLGSPPRHRAALLRNRALVARDKAHYEEAIGYLEQALPLVPDGVGPEAIRTRGMFADTYRRMGDLDTAASLYEENLAAAEATLGDAHPLLAQELNNAAAVLLRLGRLDEAEAHFERALAIRTAAFGEQNNIVGESLTNLSLVAVQRGEHDVALSLLERARAATGDGDPLQTISILGNLASVYVEKDKLDRSAALFEESIELGDAALGPGHPQVVNCRYNLALIERGRDNQERAAGLVARALDDLRVSGSEDFLVRASLYSLRGELHMDQGNAAAALADHQLALAAMEDRQLGDFPHRFHPLNKAGDAALAVGRPRDAVDYYEKAVLEAAPPIDEVELGPLHLGLTAARLATGDHNGAAEALAKARSMVQPDDAKRLAKVEAEVAAATAATK